MIQTLPSVCPLDCPDTCSLSVTVDDQQLIRVRREALWRNVVTTLGYTGIAP